MGASAQKLPGIAPKLQFAVRRFHAWWEGYAFDPAAERAALQAALLHAGSGRTVEDLVAEAIWGDGRLEPGAPAWTMRYARLLQLPVKAEMMVLGAGAGAPLEDLAHGSRWKVHGLTHAEGVSGGRLRHYSHAMERLNKATAEGALSFFQLCADPNPTAFTSLVSDLAITGARTVFVDFAVMRRGARLPKCFPSGVAPRTETEYREVLRAGGFVVDEAGDDTLAFMPLVEKGWAGWRRAYQSIMHVEDASLRAEMMRALADHAKLWAERYDAMKSGQLRVIFLRATRR